MKSSAAREILRSARIYELKAMVALVETRPPVALPHDPRRKLVRLRALLAAERRRNAALVDLIGGE